MLPKYTLLTKGLIIPIHANFKSVLISNKLKGTENWQGVDGIKYP